MSLYVLDTDILSLLRSGHAAVTQRIVAHLHDQLAVAVITAREVLDGWVRVISTARQPDVVAHAYAEYATSITFLANWTILPYRQATITRFEQLRAMRLNVGSNDLRIAAIALEHNGVVVTRNARDFGRVPGLTIENWAV